MRTHRVVHLLTAAVMLAAVARPFGNPAVCGLAGHEAVAEAAHQHALPHAATAAAQAAADSCHELMGCWLASLGMAFEAEPDIPTLQEHTEVIALRTPTVHSALLPPSTPPPKP
jgi:hypothetical protein